MKKISFSILILAIILTSCGGKSKKKRNLDETLFSYASMIRWGNYDGALNFLKPGDEDIKPTSFELERLKQFKVSSYSESPIRPGAQENVVLQSVEIQLYNIHNNTTRIIRDSQSWEYDDEKMQWFLTSGIPKF